MGGREELLRWGSWKELLRWVGGRKELLRWGVEWSY